MAGTFQGQATSLAVSDTFVKRDLNANAEINAMIQNADIIEALSQTVILTVDSAPIQVATGNKGTITYNLPDATTLVINQSYQFTNNTVNPNILVATSDGTILTSIPVGTTRTFYCTSISDSIGTWVFTNLPVAVTQLGAINTGLINSSGADISGDTLYMQYATNLEPGLVQVDNITTTVGANGVISVPIATTSSSGLVQPDGTTIVIQDLSTGTIGVPTATASALGIVQPDGITITIDAFGVISSASSGGGISAVGTINTGSLSSDGASISGSDLLLQYGSATEPGVVSVDNATIVASSGVVSVGTVPFTSITGVATVAQTTLGVTSLTPASSVAINWALGNVFTITLGQNTTFTFSNPRAGQTIMVRITNTAANFTTSWGTTGIKWSGGIVPVMSVGAVSDVYSIVYDGTSYYASAVQNFS